ncbi:MAG TPA: DUF2339 domain-containing protein [Burkholderiaceae bacterium]|nr:DUF2339 domain-containing protein [Burkholderiaceae bacterium]
MTPEDLAQRLAALEARVLRIESLLGSAQVTPRKSTDLARPAAPPEKRRDAAATREPEQPEEQSVVGGVLGWSGGVALLLAATYLIRLGIDNGWLTPQRQVGLAMLLGLALIGAGFGLRARTLRYAGLLPAVGIAVLYLAVYGSHLYYPILSQSEAGLAVIAVSAASLCLCRTFRSDLFAYFAVIGSYSAPFLLKGVPTSLIDLVIYFSAWSIVFCVFSIWQGRRSIYLWALYLALIGFDLLWRRQSLGEWTAAFAFQGAQFLIFAITTATYSVRLKAPLDESNALAHLPPLLLFYVLQYSLLAEHLPGWAPWIAVASLAAVAALYVVARSRLGKALPGGELILWGYAAVVLVHAGYIESVPKPWQPWVAFIAVPGIALIALRGTTQIGTRWPMWLAIALVFVSNYLRVISAADSQSIPARHLLAVGYALLLYGSYWFLRQRRIANEGKIVLVYMGHICAMAAAVHVFHEPMVESTIWGLIAVGCLSLSLTLKDKALRQSSLVVFAVTAGKVLLYDLNGASPVARIVGLLVLGVTFYLGGLMYHRLLADPTPK